MPNYGFLLDTQLRVLIICEGLLYAQLIKIANKARKKNAIIARRANGLL